MVPFVAPEELARRLGVKFKVRLGANESVFGASPLAIDAMQRQAAEAQWYGDPESRVLREALAEKFGGTPENFVVGPGIDGLLIHIARAYTTTGDRVASTLGTYPTFEFAFLQTGAELVRSPYVNHRIDIFALSETPAKIVYMANPDNPSGSLLSREELEQFKKTLHEETLWILDEAYADFVHDDFLPKLDFDDKNVLRLRTFSKAHGMAGIRVGFAMGHRDTLAPLHQVRGHFEVSSVAQAGALASLKDMNHLVQVIANNAKGRQELSSILRQFGLRPLPSHTNFVTVEVGPTSVELLNKLLVAGIFIRKPMQPPLDQCVRITIGRTEDHAILAEALQTIFETD